jgi:hypothetical protein
MAGQRQLEAAADARPVERGDDGLRCRFDNANQCMERRFCRGLWRIELADIGTPGEQLTRAG